MKAFGCAVIAFAAACAPKDPSLTFVDALPLDPSSVQRVHLAADPQSARESWGLSRDVLVLEGATIDTLLEQATRGPLLLTGQGAAASLAWRFACQHPDLVRTVVMLNGAADAEPCASTGIVSTLVVHGTHDDVVPYSAAWPTFERAQVLARCTTLGSGAVYEDLTAPVETFACDLSSERGIISAEHWRVVGWGHSPALPATWGAAIDAWIDLRD